MARKAAKDTTLSIPRRDNPEIVEQVFVKKGTPINLDIVGMSKSVLDIDRQFALSSLNARTLFPDYDSQVFADPESFKPERWISSAKNGTSSPSSSITKDTEAGEVSASSPASTLEGFIGFSFGPRTCLGHKFAKVEGVAFLTHLLREWRVEPVLREEEGEGMWKERVLKPEVKMTMTMKDVRLILVRRK